MAEEKLIDVYERRYIDVDYDIDDIAARYKKLYTALIYDTMEIEFKMGGRAMAPGIYPLVNDMKVAGPAFTVIRRTTATKDTYIHNMRLGLVNSMTHGCVYVSDTQGNDNCGQFGEITATTMRAHGCVGAVIDGSTRDSSLLVNMGFPTFCKFRSPVEALGRSSTVDYMVPILVHGIDGYIQVNPGDYIFGDMDGVVVVPKELTVKVLEVAEHAFEEEKGSRAAMAAGEDPFDVVNRFGRF